MMAWFTSAKPFSTEPASGAARFSEGRCSVPETDKLTEKAASLAEWIVEEAPPTCYCLGQFDQYKQAHDVPVTANQRIEGRLSIQTKLAELLRSVDAAAREAERERLCAILEDDVDNLWDWD